MKKILSCTLVLGDSKVKEVNFWLYGNTDHFQLTSQEHKGPSVLLPWHCSVEDTDPSHPQCFLGPSLALVIDTRLNPSEAHGLHAQASRILRNRCCFLYLILHRAHPSSRSFSWEPFSHDTGVHTVGLYFHGISISETW